MKAIFIVATIVYLHAPTTLHARQVLDIATSNVVGCPDKKDLIDVRVASKIPDGENGVAVTANRQASVVSQKINAGKCFIMLQQQTAVVVIEWQNPTDIWSGIVLFLIPRTGQRFYANSWQWRFVGNLD